MELTITYDRPFVLTERQTWYPEDVREMCIRHDWYTCGTCKDYEDMMDLVAGLEPTPANMMRVAQNISNHSDNTEGEADPMAIMYAIANEIVDRVFEI